MECGASYLANWLICALWQWLVIPGAWFEWSLTSFHPRLCGEICFVVSHWRHGIDLCSFAMLYVVSEITALQFRRLWEITHCCLNPRNTSVLTFFTFLTLLGWQTVAGGDFIPGQTALCDFGSFVSELYFSLFWKVIYYYASFARISYNPVYQ